MTALAVQLTDTEVTETVAGALRRAYRGNLKLVARDADVVADTAKNWVEARNPPRLADFFRLARKCPELRAEALRLMGVESDMDPEFMRDVMMLMQTWQNMKAARP
jgi:hypothetical protein